MSVRWLMFLAFVFILADIVSEIGEGSFMATGTADTINTMTAFDILESQGMIGIPIIGWQYFTQIPQLLAGNYSFFTGGLYLVRLLVVGVIGIGIAWGFISTVLPATSNLVTGLFKIR